MNNLQQNYLAAKHQAIEDMHNGNIQAYLTKLFDMQQMRQHLVQIEH